MLVWKLLKFTMPHKMTILKFFLVYLWIYLCSVEQVPTACHFSPCTSSLDTCCIPHTSNSDKYKRGWSIFTSFLKLSANRNFCRFLITISSDRRLPPAIPCLSKVCYNQQPNNRPETEKRTAECVLIWCFRPDFSFWFANLNNLALPWISR